MPVERPSAQVADLRESARVAESETRVIERALERERARRMQAEKILETRSRELFLANEALLKSNRSLADALQMLENQSHVINGLSDKHVGMTSDLDIAARLQQSMLPEPLCTNQLRVAGGFQPASYTSGDGYDYFMLDHDHFVFYLIDVSGHGMASALISFAVQNHLKSLPQLLSARDMTVASAVDSLVLDAVNELNVSFATRDEIPHYFTMVFGVIDLRSGEVSYARAGHPSPLHLDCTEKRILEYAKGGLPIGMFVEAEFCTQTCVLAPGDRFVLYSDGVTDCDSRDGNTFGVDGLKQQMLDTWVDTPQNVVKELEDKLYRWQASSAFEDDVSILVIDFVEKIST